MNTKKAALTVLSITLRIVVLALVLIGLLRLGTAAYYYGHAVFQAETMDPEPGREVTVTLEKSDSVADIGKILQDKGLIEDWKLFYLQARMSRYYETMAPGTYTLTTAMTPKEMMAIMSLEGLEEEEES